MELRELEELEEPELELALDRGTAGLLGRGVWGSIWCGRRRVDNAVSFVYVLVVIRRSLSRSFSSPGTFPLSGSRSLSLRGEPGLVRRVGERGTFVAGSRVTTGARTGASTSGLRDMSLFERRRTSESPLGVNETKAGSRPTLEEYGDAVSREPESRRSGVRGVAAMGWLREGGELDGDLLGGM